MKDNQNPVFKEVDMSAFRFKPECYNLPEYCAYKIEPKLRNCQCCSLTHYFHDCNGNPIYD